jgi:hypothetical protein
MSKSFAVFLSIALFLVLRPPTTQAQTTWISSLSASTTSTTATLAWTTAVPATTQVRYGLTTSYGSHTNLDSTFTGTHSVTMTALTPGTVYHLRITAKDAQTVLVTSLDYTITTQAGTVSVTVSPTAGTVASGGSQQFTAKVNNATNKAVTWKASIGSITTGGMFTAPAVSSDQPASITATSVADPTKSATAVLTIKAPIQHTVSLTWQASGSNGIVAYNAYRSNTRGGPYALIASMISGLAYTDLAVQAGTTYYYVVTASDDHGEESANSVEAVATVPSP